MIFMSKFINNLLPISFHSTFKLNNKIEAKRRMRNSDTFYIEFCALSFYQKLPLFNFPHIWNTMSNSIKYIAPSTSSETRQPILYLPVNFFRFKFKNYLISLYNNEVWCANPRCMLHFSLV